MRTQQWQKGKPVLKKKQTRSDNQPLRPAHQRALRPAIYKHLLEPKLQICYRSRGWMCYKYTALPQLPPFFLSLIQETLNSDSVSEIVCASHEPTH